MASSSSFDAGAEGDALDEHVFALANAESVCYRDVVSLQRCLDECSGGVVWESAHVLVRYFLEGQNSPLRAASTICELGAGCGLLGTALARYHRPRPSRVTLTEASPALEHLRANVTHNEPTHPPGVPRPEVCLLDWLNPSLARLGTYDCVIGTDVMFSPELIGPLLSTAASLCHAESVVWLCAPRRCERAWAILEEALPLTFGTVELLTERLHSAVPVAKLLEVELWRCAGPLALSPPDAAAAGAAATAAPAAAAASSASDAPAVSFADDESKPKRKKTKKRRRDGADGTEGKSK